MSFDPSLESCNVRSSPSTENGGPRQQFVPSPQERIQRVFSVNRSEPLPCPVKEEHSFAPKELHTPDFLFPNDHFFFEKLKKLDNEPRKDLRKAEEVCKA